MSRFDYSKNPVVKRVDTIEVETKNHMDILTSNDLNRVQKVMAIRNYVRDCYTNAYRDIVVTFVDGVIEELVAKSKEEGRPLPEKLVFNVELRSPLVEASTVPVGLKSESAGTRNYKNYGAYKGDDHIYWT